MRGLITALLVYAAKRPLSRYVHEIKGVGDKRELFTFIIDYYLSPTPLIVLTKNDKKILVQFKHWKTQKVGVKTVRELYGVLINSGADEVNIVCSGEFTNDAIDFVKDKAIYLIDGDKLTENIQGIQSQEYAQSRDMVVSCPACGSDMVLRLAKQGADAGKQFYGCSTYPKCKGTRNY